MAGRKNDPTGDAVKAGVLSWLLPGAGHIFLGQRSLGIVLLVAVSVPYWTGMALGGILDSVNLRTNRWLTLAAMGVGGFTTPCYFASAAIEAHVLRTAGLSAIPAPGDAEANSRFLKARAPFMAFFPGIDVSQIYLAAAGLLNLLVIIDAVSRGLYGEPTYHRELLAADQARTATEGGPA